MICTHEQYELALKRVKEYEENLKLAHGSNDVLLQNPTIRYAYLEGMRGLVRDLKSQIKRYENELIVYNTL